MSEDDETALKGLVPGIAHRRGPERGRYGVFHARQSMRVAVAGLHRRHEHVRQSRRRHALPDRHLAARPRACAGGPVLSPSGVPRRRRSRRLPPAIRTSIVTDFVEDIRPIVRESAVYVVPLRVGGGTRLKVLDAMAMGKALVSTSIGCEGIDVEPGRHLVVADTAEAFARETVALMNDEGRRRALGSEARALVDERYAWPVVARSLTDAYRCAIELRKRPAKEVPGEPPRRRRLSRRPGLGAEPHPDRLQHAARARALQRPVRRVPVAPGRKRAVRRAATSRRIRTSGSARSWRTPTRTCRSIAGGSTRAS